MMPRLLILLALCAFPLFGAFPDICSKCWYEVPDSELQDMFPDPAPPGTGGINSRLNWSGAAFDSRRSQLIIAGGGGGEDNSGNEVYAFNVDSLKWFRLNNPASSFDDSDAVSPYFFNGGAEPDSQQPRPGYTYDLIQYDSISDKIFIMGLPFAAQTSYGWRTILALHLGSLTWSSPGEMVPYAGSGSVSSYDPNTRKIWVFANSSEDGDFLGHFNLSDSSWTDHGNIWTDGALENHQNSAIMPSTQRMISVGAGYAKYWDITETGDIPSADLEPTDCEDLMDFEAPGFAWYPGSRKMMAWIGGTHVITMDSTYTCNDVAPNDSNTVTPDDPNIYGTYGRWQYVPKHNVFVVVNSADSSVWLYRPSPGTGSSPPSPPVVVISSPATDTTVGLDSILIKFTVDAVPDSQRVALNLDTNVIIISRSNGGGTGKDTVIVYRDMVAPVVVIYSPPNHKGFVSSLVDIGWTIDGDTQSVQVTASLVSGANTIVRSDTDAVGNIGSDTITLYLDNQGPTVSITSPANYFETNHSPATLVWKIDDVVQDTMNSVTLLSDTTQVIRQGRDSLGNIGKDTIYIVLDLVPPTVVISLPIADAVITSSPASVAWSVNGAAQSAQLTEAMIGDGTRYIIRTATDAAGNQGADTVRVISDVVGPIVVIDTPANNSYTRFNSTGVKWTVDGLEQETGTLQNFSGDGEYFIIRCATDSLAREGCDTNRVVSDQTPPVIELVSPSQSAVIVDADVDIEWKIDGVSQSPRNHVMDSSEANVEVFTTADSAGNTDTLVVTLYSGINVPNLLTKTYRQADSLLRVNGLGKDSAWVDNDTVASGIIFAQIPSSGAIPYHFQVHYKISRGLDAKDLVPVSLSAKDMTVNPQSLAAGGFVRLELANLGRDTVEDEFWIVAYEDLNRDQKFTRATDLVLGETKNVNPIYAGNTAVFEIAVSGGLAFNGNRISVMVDTANSIPETNEENNTIHTMANCKKFPLEVDFNPKLVWKWNDTSAAHERSYSTPLVAHLTDNNADGKFDEKDIPTVVFYTENWLIALDGRTGSELWRKGITNWQFSMPAIGDLDGDGSSEIVTVETQNDHERRLAIFDREGERIDGGLFFYFGGDTWWPTDQPNLSDLDGDGKAEILWGPNVYDRHGKLIFKRDKHILHDIYSITPDLDQDGFQEILSQVDTDIGTRKLSITSFKDKAFKTQLAIPTNEDIPIVTRLGNVPRILFYNLFDRPIQTGDGGYRLYNLDLDSMRTILVSSFETPDPGAFLKGAQADIFFYGKGNKEQLFEIDRFFPSTYAEGPLSTFSFMTRLNFTDSSITYREFPQSLGRDARGTVFDFEDDNDPEVVIRHGDSLVIMDGEGNNLGFFADTSAGQFYGDVGVTLADVDNNGIADIIAEGGDDDRYIAMYSNPTWVGARTVYNQRNYSVNNINDDGSIPRFPAPTWLNDNTLNIQCTEGHYACIDITASLPQFIPNTVAHDSVFARIGNGGARTLAQGIPVTLYAIHLGEETKLTTVCSPKRLEPGEYYTFKYQLPDSLKGAYGFRFAADDSGSGIGELDESDEINNSVVLSFMVNNHAPIVTAPGSQYGEPGTLFSETIVASDPDDDDLTFHLIEAPLGMSIHPTTGVLSWTPPTGLPRVIVRIAVSDDHQATTITSMLIYLDDGSNNEPVIETIENRTVLLNALNVPVSRVYREAIVATDEDNERLEYELECLNCGDHEGAQPNLAGNQITWVPFMPSWEDGDTIALQAKVIDERGGIATRTFYLYLSNPAVDGNHAPAFRSAPPTTAIAGSEYKYLFKAGDADNGNTIGFNLLSTHPTGMYIDGDTLRWSTPSTPGATANVQLQVVDNHSASATQTWVITLRPDSIPPSVYITFSRNPVRPGESVTVTVHPRDNIGVDSWGLDSSDEDVSLGAGTTFTFSPAYDDEIHFKATVEDTTGNVGHSTAILRVRSDADHTPPIVSLSHSPEDPDVGDFVTFTVTASDSALENDRMWVQVDGLNLPVESGSAGYYALRPGDQAAVVVAFDSSGNSASDTDFYSVSPITGDATSPIAELDSPEEDSIVYSPIEVYGTATDAHLAYYTLSYRENGTATWIEFERSSNGVSDNKLGVIDATTMTNGDYEVRLDVYDQAENHSSESTKVTIAGEKKVGNFSLAFQDLTLPMAGLDLTVTRTYDSRIKTKGDFGVGWKMGMRSITLYENRIQGESWDILPSGLIHSLVELKTHSVSVTLPGGRKQEFTPRPQFFSPFVPAFGTMTYEANPGTFSKLEALDVGSFVVMGTDLYDIDGFFEESFNPQLFKLTLLDGSYFIIDQNKGGVIESGDANGNVVNWDSAAVTHNSGDKIEFTRDSEGRVSGINDGAGRSMQYVYDVLGNLGRVVDGNGNITTFKYGPDHFLTDIVDARGVRANKTIYDEDGRIIQQVNANGDNLFMTHDIDHNFEEIEDFNGNITSYSYDLHGNVTRKMDDAGKSWFFSYDSADNLLSTLAPDGTLKTSTYDDAGNELTTTDEMGNTTERTYNDQGKPITVTDALNRTTSFEYDAYGNMIKETGPDGVVTARRTYDAKGNVLTEKDALGNQTINTYNSKGWLLTTKNPRGFIQRNVYDAAGNVDSLYDYKGNRSHFEYDNNGNRISQYDAYGNHVSTQYNAINKPIRLIDALGNVSKTVYNNLGDRVADTTADSAVTLRSYDKQGNVASITDPIGRITEMQYDFENRVIRTIFADDSSTTTTYDARGRRKRTVDAMGNETRYEYDNAGRNTAVIDALGEYTRYGFDGVGRKTFMEDALGQRTEYEYDEYDRLTRTTYDDDSYKSITYDDAGKKATETDQMGYVTHFNYDSTGNLVEVIGAIGDITTYTYDGNNNRLTQTDAIGQTTSMAYDSLNRMTLKTYPNGHWESWTYDKNGNILTHVKGFETTTYQYDKINREKYRLHSNSGHTVVTTYFKDGKRKAVIDYRGMSTFSYDLRGRLAGEGFVNGDSLENHYDANGNRTSLISMIGDTTRSTLYTYDELNRMKSVVSPQGKTTAYTYNAVGNRATVTNPNSNSTAYGYDYLNRLTSVTHTGPGGTLASYTYTLNAAGIRTEVAELDGSHVYYGYDSLYRLKSERRTGAHTDTMTYTYDPVGNRLTKAQRGVTTTYAYNTRDQLTGETDGTNSIAYSYDSAGRMLSKAEVGGTTYYRWRDEDRLDSLYGPGVSVKYQYDADGRRVKDSTGSTVRQYLIDPLLPYGQVIAETDGSNSLVSEYVFGLDRVSLRRSGAAHYYLADGQGSIRMLTDSNGAVSDSNYYTAFGEDLFHSGSTANDFRYVGEQLDPNSGFYYNRARWYNGRTGRFASVDPYSGDPQSPISLHRYIYSNVSPLSYRDPSGMLGIYDATAAIIVSSIANAYAHPAFTCNGCTTKERLVIDQSLKTAARMVDAAQRSIGGGIDDNYLTWFDNSASISDPSSMTRYRFVKKGWVKLNSIMLSKSIRFTCIGIFKEGRAAHINTGDKAYRIALDRKFWTIPFSGRESKGGSIVHELSHEEIGTSDTEYGQVNASILAGTAPSLAILNADNWEYYAEDAL